MLGYISKEEAKKIGFTHRAGYFGIPCYVSNEKDEYGEEGLMVQPIFHFLEPVFDLFMHIEQTIRPLIFPDDEPGFQFKLNGKL